MTSDYGPPIAGDQSSHLAIRLFGPVTVVVDEVEHRIESSIRRALLALFALNPNRRLGADYLLEEAWLGEAGSRASLYVHISTLRRRLAPTGPDHHQQCLTSVTNGYQLEVDPLSIDIHRFDYLVDQGIQKRNADPVGAIKLLCEAEALAADAPLAGLEEYDFYEPHIRRLNETKLKAIEVRIDLELALGRTAHLPAELASLERDYPDSESFVRQHMTALVAQERPTEALRIYQHYRSALIDRTGLDPSPRLQRLEHLILEQTPILDQFDTNTSEARPVGAVLLAEVVAARRRWVEATATMHQAQQRLEKLITVVAPANGGRVLGDDMFSVMGMFADSGDAVKAAVRLQLEAKADPHLGCLPIRAVVAVPTKSLGGELSNPIEVARYLAPHARPGGVFTTGEALPSVVDAGFKFVLAGKFRCHIELGDKDLYQVDHPSLERPSSTWQTVVGSVPLAPEPLVGRTQDLVDVGRALGCYHTVSVVGPVGVGGSSLLIEVARQMMSHYDDGVAYVSLSELTGDQVLTKIAAALGVAANQSEALPAILGASVGRDRLLVLDNASHVLDQVKELVRRRTEMGVDLQILISSHCGLDMSSEWVHVLRPLTVDDSVDLVRARARAAGASIGHDAESQATLRALCQLVDCLPASLEQVASKLRLVPLIPMYNKISHAGVLGSRFLGLSGPIGQAIEIIMARLDEGAAQVYCGLGVFAGHQIQVEALSAVSGQAEPELMESLGQLSQWSLVEAVGGPSGVIYQTLKVVKEYARRRLGASGGIDQWAQRHADHFRHVVAQAVNCLGGADQSVWKLRLEADLPEFEAALRWYVDSGSLREAASMIQDLARYGLQVDVGSDGSPHPVGPDRTR